MVDMMMMMKSIFNAHIIAKIIVQCANESSMKISQYFMKI